MKYILNNCIAKIVSATKQIINLQIQTCLHIE
jgi:hypothetical protein